MTRFCTPITLALLLLASSALPARADAPGDLLTKGKVQADLGNFGNAAELFGKASADPAASDAVRWESLTRLALTKRKLRDQAGAHAAFGELIARYGTVPDAQRFLVENVIGLSLTDEHWLRIQPELSIAAVEHPVHGASLRTDWGTDGEACDYPGSAEDLSLDFLDAKLGDVFRFFKDFTKVPFDADPCVNDMLITLRIFQQPWDAALRTITGSYGLGCRYEEGRGFRITCGPSSPTPEMTRSPMAAAPAAPGAAKDPRSR